MGEGDALKEMGVKAWGLGQPYEIKTSWSPVGSQQRPSASSHVLTIPTLTSSWTMNLTMNTTSYQEVAHFYMGEGRGPLPNLHPTNYDLFKFCVIDALPVPVNLFNNLIYLIWHQHSQNKQHTPCQLHSALKCKTNMNYQQMVHSVLY